MEGNSQGKRLWTYLPGIVLISLVGIAVGLGVFTFGYARGASYLSDNPDTCMNCHVMRDQYEAWGHSTHARVATCNDCHTAHDFLGKWITKAINGWNHSVAFTLDNFHEPIRIKDFNARIVENSCIHCHEPLLDQVYEHMQIDNSLTCISCHADVGHPTRN
ncbi:MAG: cytochrome c nitrite reductase small subunit [Phototrophicaceae bacterium]